MSRAKIGDIEVIIYRYYWVGGHMLCDVKFPYYKPLIPVLAELIEVMV